MPEVNPALFSWFRVYLALFLDILQKCCYPEPEPVKIGLAPQHWKDGGMLLKMAESLLEPEPAKKNRSWTKTYYLGEMETGNRIQKYFGMFIWGPRWVRFES